MFCFASYGLLKIHRQLSMSVLAKMQIHKAIHLTHFLHCLAETWLIHDHELAAALPC